MNNNIKGRPDFPKILIITTPIRPEPTDFPPLGSLSIITALRKSGFQNVEFYNIDYLRPDYTEVINHIKAQNPDILGISAVVSTAYNYSKKISLDIKAVLPEIIIILGGNLGASAEIVLKKTGVDFVCTGEGETTMVEFASCWKDAQTKDDFKNVKGLAFYDVDENLTITPFPDPIPAEQVYEIDWSILDKWNQGDFFFPLRNQSSTTGSHFLKDPRIFEPHRAEKRLATVAGSKGCVARCTFCHRWDKGIRYIPVSKVMERVDFLMEKYNVGFINFADENFGTDRKWLTQFIKEIKKRDVLWRVGGMRVNTIKPEFIADMKKAGCMTILYGMETGSQKMLDVMEKVTKVEQNYNTLKWMAENKLRTTVQLIIGMPGETTETIEETSRFTSYFVEQSPETDPNALSINFAQALPGTPLYEVGRRKNFIGKSLDEEEQYLLKISDRDARDGETYINLTDYPKLCLETWHFQIQNTTRNAYVRKWGLANYHNIILQTNRYKGLKEWERFHNKDTGYFASPARQSEIGYGTTIIPSPWSLIKQKRIGAASTFYPLFFWKTRCLSPLYVLFNETLKNGFKYGLDLLREYLGWKVSLLFIRSKSSISDYISLRKLIRKKTLPDIPSDNPAMAVLRKGR